jgi:putative phosphoribosyl transferase
MGAIAAAGVRVVNYDVVSWFGISGKTLDQVAARELRELQRRDRAYRGDRPFPQIRNQTILLVDDGIATGSTMRAAISVLRQEKPNQIVVAIPVAPSTVCEELQAEVEAVVCVKKPEPFYAIGLWYDDFSQTTDEEVQTLLAQPTVVADHPAIASLP